MGSTRTTWTTDSNTTASAITSTDFDVSLGGTLTIAGATQLNSTLTIGVDDTGYDVKFFGATSGKYMLWDESEDTLVVSNIGVNESSPDNVLHVTNSNGVTKECIKLEQLDVDEPFILFTGTSASDQTKSITTDTSVGSLTGHVLVSVNGTDYWIPFYAAN